MEEKVFLKEGRVLVSSTRIDINGQTFATRNVGSVRVEAPGVSKLSLVLILIGAVAGVNQVYVLAGCGLAAGVIWALTTTKQRKLKLVAGGDEVMALETQNPKLAEKVRAAIAEAISVR